MNELHTLLSPYSEQIGQALHEFIARQSSDGKGMWPSVGYHLGWKDSEFRPTTAPKGKRIRSAICLMACEAVGARTELALPGAMAVELVHEFSLVHDDIQDQDKVRRHRPALWTVIGVPQAINTGDALFALAQLAIFDESRGKPSTERRLRAARALNEATVALAQGQHLDLSFESRTRVTPAEYLAMIRGKTAALLAASAQIGALLAMANSADYTALYDMGMALGMAFQMQDDLLGLWGDPSLTGKAVGADIRAGKKSLPVTYALSQPGGERLRALYDSPLVSDADVTEALSLIEATGAQQYTRNLMDDYYVAARQQLQNLADAGHCTKKLAAVVDLLETRDH